MSFAQIRPDVPFPYRIVALLLALLVLGYAVLVGQLFLGLFTIFAVAALGLVLYLVYLFFHLFYRLVVAVEHLAYE